MKLELVRIWSVATLGSELQSLNNLLPLQHHIATTFYDIIKQLHTRHENELDLALIHFPTRSATLGLPYF